MEQSGFVVRVSVTDDYHMSVDFGDALPLLDVDEKPGEEPHDGPSALQLLAASVASCLGGSLLFCLRRSRATVRSLTVDVSGHMVRNDRGRLRIGGMVITLRPDVPEEERDRLVRCISMFEDFCVVSESVRRGIPMEIEVVPQPEPAGAAS